MRTGVLHPKASLSAIDVRPNVATAPGGTRGDGAKSPHLRRPLDPRLRSLVGLETLIAACGLSGGAYMVSHATTVMPLDYLAGTWFATWLWPGVSLFFFVGVCPAVVVAVTLARRRAERWGHVAVGVGLVAWIALEAAWIVVSPVLQTAVGLIGIMILALGCEEWWLTRRIGR